MADATGGADAADDREDDVLGGGAVVQFAVDVDAHPLWRALRERLRGEHVLHLARADAEREGSERAVRCGVAVSAHDRHTRQCAALLGADHVHDPLVLVAHGEQRDAELLCVLAHHLNLSRRDRVGDREVNVCGRDVVVLGGDREFGPAYLAAGQAKTVECLRARDLVDQMEVDVEEVGLAGCTMHHVALPHLLGQCARHDRYLTFWDRVPARWTV